MRYFTVQAFRKTASEKLFYSNRNWANRNLTSVQGFSLLESLIVIVIAGILSAIAVPGMLGWYAQYRMDHTVAQIQGAMQEAQRQAIRSSRPCPIAVDGNGVRSTCLITGNRKLQGASLQFSTNTFQFNIKGAITNSSGQLLSSPVTIKVSSGASRVQRCLVVSAPLGFVKTGTYRGNDLNEQNCIP